MENLYGSEIFQMFCCHKTFLLFIIDVNDILLIRNIKLILIFDILTMDTSSYLVRFLLSEAKDLRNNSIIT